MVSNRSASVHRRAFAPSGVVEATLRSIAALPLAYMGATGLTVAATTLLRLAGVARAEAVGWPLFASLPVWLVLALYAFAAQPLWRGWLASALCAATGALAVIATDVGGSL